MSQNLDGIVDRVSSEIREDLRDEVGLDDLTKKKWGDLENPAVDIGDRVTKKVLQALLEDQAGQVAKRDGHACPRCGKAMDDKSDEAHSLQTKRGWVHWKQPQQRCSRCRCDFFPSGPGAGN